MFVEVHNVHIYARDYPATMQLLMLDGKLQSAEKDERAYHECLVQPAMLHHPNPSTVFICGGIRRSWLLVYT